MFPATRSDPSRAPLSHAVPSRTKSQDRAMHQLADWLRTETANLPNMRYIEATRSGEPKRKKVNISHNQGGPRAGLGGVGPRDRDLRFFQPPRRSTGARSDWPSAGSGASVFQLSLRAELMLIGPQRLLASRFQPVVSVQLLNGPVSKSQQSRQATDAAVLASIATAKETLASG